MEKGRRNKEVFLKLGLGLDSYVGSGLVKFLCMEDAEKVFEQLPVREDEGSA